MASHRQVSSISTSRLFTQWFVCASTGSVPLAFPATSDFTFALPDFQTSSTISNNNRKPPIRAIQILPTDILVVVVQASDIKRHPQMLRSLSLVNRALNSAIAPILYRHIRISNLPDVYQFSLGPRHPTCITSLEMFITPDPSRRHWSPPDSNWADRLAEVFSKMERLMSLAIKRCENDVALPSIVRCAKDPQFLPLLQKLSFGPWHQLSSLSFGRPITTYGLLFSIQALQDYDRLEQLLATIGQSGEAVRELNLTINVPSDGLGAEVDHRKDVLYMIGEQMPDLQVLAIRFQCKHSVVDLSFVRPLLSLYNLTLAKPLNCSQNLNDVVKMIPPSLAKLTSLEIFDSRFQQYQSERTIEVAASISARNGPCPHLQYINFDGLLWKRAQDTLPSFHDATALIPLSSLTLEDGTRPDQDQRPAQPEISRVLAPKLTWTPCPSDKRGRKWWERRAYKLHATSQVQAVKLLWQWMLEYWGRDYIPEVGVLERTVTRW